MTHGIRPQAEATPREAALLAGCDPEQVEAITTRGRPLCVLAGAGSGKTRVLTRRIAWRVMEGSALAAHVLALTFTRKASGELQSRLANLGLPESVTAGTFHSVALAELKRLAAEKGRRPPVVVGSKIRILMDVLASSRVSTRPGPARHRAGGSAAYGRANRSVADLASEIEWAKARCLGPDDFVRAAAVAGRRGPWASEEVAWIWRAYELEKNRRQVLDFEDLLLRTTDQLLSDPRFAASARWRYRHVFVDEYQDVNESQQRLLRAWLGDNDDLCVVGDPNQAIYSWNGANPRAISDFPDEFAGSTVLTLSINYRSTHEVLSVAGAVLGERQAAPTAGPRPEGPVPTVTGYGDELAEAAGVGEAVRRARRPGRTWAQIAILSRTNAQLRVIEEALVARGVPCQTSGSFPLLRKPWVEDALAAVARAGTRDLLAAWRVDLLTATALASDEEAGGESGSSPSEAQLDLESLARLAGDYLTEDSAATGAGFRSWLEAAQASEAGLRRRDAVELTTFHRAKGLEWPVVFLTGLELGYVPITHAKDADALAEERRLLYVACTRAAEELHCSWAAQRSFSSGAPIPRSPSPWLAAIEAAHNDLERLRQTAPDTARRALAESRRALEKA